MRDKMKKKERKKRMSKRKMMKKLERMRVTKRWRTRKVKTKRETLLRAKICWETKTMKAYTGNDASKGGERIIST
jgi:hypothetical protein